MTRLGGAFDSSNRTVDVRRIAPRARTAAVPDRASLDIALHGPGRDNIPNIGAFVWRWIAFPVTRQPAFVVDARRFMASPLGADMPLFNPPPRASRSTSLTGRGDVPQPIGRREFHDDPAAFYGADNGLEVIADGALASAWTASASATCPTPRRSAAGRLRRPARWRSIRCWAASPLRADLPAPGAVRVSYYYGFPADIGGGPYDRARAPALQPRQVTFQRVIGAGATDMFGCRSRSSRPWRRSTPARRARSG